MRDIQFEEDNENSGTSEWGDGSLSRQDEEDEVEQDTDLLTFIDQLKYVEMRLKRYKELVEPGDKGKRVAVGLTYLQTAILWLEVNTRVE